MVRAFVVQAEHALVIKIIVTILALHLEASNVTGTGPTQTCKSCEQTWTCNKRPRQTHKLCKSCSARPSPPSGQVIGLLYDTGHCDKVAHYVTDHETMAERGVTGVWRCDASAESQVAAVGWPTPCQPGTQVATSIVTRCPSALTHPLNSVGYTHESEWHESTWSTRNWSKKYVRELRHAH